MSRNATMYTQTFYILQNLFLHFHYSSLLIQEYSCTGILTATFINNTNWKQPVCDRIMDRKMWYIPYSCILSYIKEGTIDIYAQHTLYDSIYKSSRTDQSMFEIRIIVCVSHNESQGNEKFKTLNEFSRWRTTDWWKIAI